MTTIRDPRLPPTIRRILRRSSGNTGYVPVVGLIAAIVLGSVLRGHYLYFAVPVGSLCLTILVLRALFPRMNWLVEHLLDHPRDIAAIEARESRPDTLKVRFRNGRATRVYAEGRERAALIEYILERAPHCEERTRS